MHESEKTIEEKQANPFKIRIHHLDMYCDLERVWKDVSSVEPWNINRVQLPRLTKFVSERWTNEHMRGWIKDYKHSTELKQYLNEKNDSPIFINWVKGNIKYFEDVLGENLCLKDETQALYNKIGQNFLIATATPTNVFNLNLKPDAICYSCKGGISGTGEHCTKRKGRKFEIPYLERASVFLNTPIITKNGGMLQVNAKTLWDDDFLDFVLITK